MARQENDREDLLAEATALVERAELAVPGFEQPLVAGFRRDGSASLYFGSDPVYHFNSRGELRRGYVEGRLYKAQPVQGARQLQGATQGRLVSLERRRAAGEVQLLRHDLTADESGRFVDALAGRLVTLRLALDAGQFRTVGQVPANLDVVGRVRGWLDQLPLPIFIASSPRVK